MSSRRRALRVIGGAAVAALSLGVYVACGFDGAAMGAGGDDASTAIDAGPVGEDAANDGNQGGCSAERTVCGTTCTDLSADPENCGACGKKCDVLQTCSESQCTILCIGGQQRCGDTCIDTTSDPANCGGCGKTCPADQVCLGSKCSKDCMGQTQCGGGDAGAAAGADAGVPAYCANVDTDRRNCGACGVTCKANEVCKAKTCTPVCATNGRVGDVFSPKMVGCVALGVTWDYRARICPAGSTVCGADQWKAERGGKAPTFNYWTNDYLQYLGADQACRAVPLGQGGACNGYPMHVCAAKTDPVGHSCYWTNCGLGTNAPNEYFGGCSGDYYAGALCCTP